MSEKRADELKKGDVLQIKGDRWTVLKAKVRGKSVHLVIDGRRGTFDSDVKAKERYTLLEDAGTGVAPRTEQRARVQPRGDGGPLKPGRSSGPLLDKSGAQTRWATRDEHREIVPPSETGPTRAWDDAPKSDGKLVEHLAAKLVGVEVEGGKLIVPPVTDTTILGHLVTMHSVRYDGVSVKEALAWARKNDPGSPATAAQVLDALTLQRAHELHENLHIDFAAIPRPHWHRERAPK